MGWENKQSDLKAGVRKNEKRKKSTKHLMWGHCGRREGRKRSEAGVDWAEKEERWASMGGSLQAPGGSRNTKL